MRKILLGAAWGQCDERVIRRSAAENAPGCEVVVLRITNTRGGWVDRWKPLSDYCATLNPDDRVLTVDVRDTVIQADPFPAIGYGPRVLVFGEPAMVSEEPWNLDGYRRFAGSVGKHVPIPPPDSLGIVNGGFVAGRAGDVAWACLARTFLDYAHDSADQSSAHVLPVWGAGLVARLGHGNAGIVYHGHWWAKDGRADHQERACRPDGTPYPVFHQYDRTPLCESVMERYG